MVQDDDGDFIQLKNEGEKIIIQINEQGVLAAVSLTKEQLKWFIKMAEFEAAEG